MYNRLSNEDIFRINQKVKTDRLFQNLYHALSSVGIDCKDITPEEIWEIASNELTIIAASEVKIFDVNTLHNKLRMFFAEYKNEDGMIYSLFLLPFSDIIISCFEKRKKGENNG